MAEVKYRAQDCTRQRWDSPQVTAGSAVKRDQLKREGRYRATPDCTGNSQPLTSGTMHFPSLLARTHMLSFQFPTKKLLTDPA